METPQKQKIVGKIFASSMFLETKFDFSSRIIASVMSDSILHSYHNDPFQ
jgi:hypothetical protein